MGFFTPSTLTQAKPTTSKLPQCGACGLHKQCKTPKIPIQGRGARKILVVGEAPGAEEDKQGRFFCGQSGQELRRAFDQLGLSLEEDAWLYNSLICRPPGNADPTQDQIDYCRPNLMREIEEKQPEIIILLGGPAVRSLLGGIWKPSPGGIGQWAGFQIPSQRLNAWICPTFHPSYVLRNSKEGEKGFNPVVKLWWMRHLKAAVALEGRPWETIRDYDSEIKIVWNPDEAAIAIERFIGKRPVCLDFEADGLKPEARDLVSCALSDGKRTISYLWGPETRKASGKLFFSGTPLIAANSKYEQRWIIKEFGRRAPSMWYDPNLGMHIVDNRKGITGLKFQSFACLGYSGTAKQHRYDEVVKSYFQTAKGGNDKNDIRKLDMTQLLHYGGLDALLAWEVAIKQRKLFKDE